MMFTYVVIMCGLILQAAIVCHHNQAEWETEVVPHCPLGLRVAVSHYIGMCSLTQPSLIFCEPAEYIFHSRRSRRHASVL